MEDLFDPRTWFTDGQEYRIYASWDVDGIYALVDAEDYSYLSRYLWCVHNAKKPDHPYLKRTWQENLGPDGAPYVSPLTGKLVRDRKRVQHSEFLHAAVMRRSGKKPPTFQHVEIDHIDRDVLNCRRCNLRWSTRKEQIRNSKWAQRFRTS